MICTCEHCHFIFSRALIPEQCPDCGKPVIRQATEEERLEFERNLAESKRVSALGRDMV